MALRIYTNMFNLWIGHIYLFFVTFYREINEAKQGTIGIVMKFNEVCGTMIYLAFTIVNLQFTTIFLGFRDLTIEDVFVRKFFNVQKMA